MKEIFGNVKNRKLSHVISQKKPYGSSENTLNLVLAIFSSAEILNYIFRNIVHYLLSTWELPFMEIAYAIDASPTVPQFDTAE